MVYARVSYFLSRLREIQQYLFSNWSEKPDVIGSNPILPTLYSPIAKQAKAQHFDCCILLVRIQLGLFKNKIRGEIYEYC